MTNGQQGDQSQQTGDIQQSQQSNQSQQQSQQTGDGQQGSGQSQQQSGGQQTENQAPPWGDDRNFDPDRAWTLIQNLRNDKSQLTTERDQYKGQVDEAERAKMTEQQRVESDRDSHRNRADKAERDLLQLQIGLDKGLSAAQARRLAGTTQAELEADADAMLEEIGEPRNSGGRRPRENLRGGTQPDQEPETTDPAALAAKVPR